MSDIPDSPIFDDSEGTPESSGQKTDEGKGRIFPCEGCGADLKFHIGQQNLKCPFCGYEKEIVLDADAEVAEQDFHAVLTHVLELRSRKQQEADAPTDLSDQKEVQCESCSATVVFLGALTSSECPYCASPIQLEHAHKAEDRVPADGVLPFLVTREKAKANLAAWVGSRWFAPNDFLKRGVEGKFNGVYLPYWTYDTLTANRYSGERGEDYQVTVGTGDNKRTETRTRWYHASGDFQRFFDDVLIPATTGLSNKLLNKLEPWPLHNCLPFNQESLAGYLARTYEVELDTGFTTAKSRIDAVIDTDVRQRIGGDRQRVHSINTHYAAITFKHLLLPTWLMAYRYHETIYQIVVNAGTGEVQGERPYSWVKITLAVLFGLAAAAAIFFIAQS